MASDAKRSGSEALPFDSSGTPVEPADRVPVDNEPDGPTTETETVDDDYEYQELLDPIHQFIRFSQREIRIINHPAFQRLFRMQQLGQTSIVYRGATHNRGQHAFGALHTVTLLCDAIDRRVRATSPDRERWKLGPRISGPERAFARLAALLHDVGHIAAGHTLEDELGLLDLHDADERLDLILDRDIWHDVDITVKGNPVGETLRDRIEALYRPEAASIALSHNNGEPMSADKVLIHLISKDHANAKATEYDANDFRIEVVRDLVGNTLCADLLDYIHRDWHHIGKPKHFDERILHYIETRHRRDLNGPDGRTENAVVVNLISDKAGRFRSDAVTAIVDLLDSRYELWETALLHRTKTAAAGMLERAIGEIVHELGYFGGDAPRVAQISEKLLECLIEATDFDIYRILGRDIGQSALATLGNFRKSAIATELLWRISQRILHKQVTSITMNEAVLPQAAMRVARTYAPSSASLGDQPVSSRDRRDAAEARRHLLVQLETEFVLSPGSLAMYCVPFGMGQKLAGVQVLHHGGVDSLAEIDKSDRVSRGQLSAQLERFDNLWRCSLFIKEEELPRLVQLDLVDDLGGAFHAAVRVEDDEKSTRQMQLIARKIKDTLPEHYPEAVVLKDPRQAARGDDEQILHKSAIPTVLAFFDYGVDSDAT